MAKMAENAVFRVGQTQIAADNLPKQRVAGSIPIARSKYDFQRVKSFFFRRLRAAPYL